MAEIISILKNDLDYYDKILFFKTRELFFEFCQSKVVSTTNLKVLVLSLEQTLPRVGNITFRQISEEEVRQLKELYYMYQFSDKFLFISNESTNYASLFHFVNTGVLSKEEVFEALLH